MPLIFLRKGAFFALIQSTNRKDASSVLRQFGYLLERFNLGAREDILGVDVSVIDNSRRSEQDNAQVYENLAASPSKSNDEEKHICITSDPLPVECAPGTKFEGMTVSERVCGNIGSNEQNNAQVCGEDATSLSKSDSEKKHTYVTNATLSVECAPGTKFEGTTVRKRVCRNIG